ncbi:DUF6461 domain-containing protein [Nonomuraea sp. NPDC050783]|uniref:DUF6461 domain-containing protein n=1 Tax=Nonomuraea sp. NPDC050783 TaxID=3154634 RepID=UPI003466C907
MRGVTAEDYRWVEEFGDLLGSGFCVTFVKELDPREVLRRLRAVDDPDHSGPGGVEAGPAQGGFDPAYRGHGGTRHPDDQVLDAEYPDMIPGYRDPGDGFVARHLEAAFALAEHRTGVRLEPGHLRGMPLYASIAHYYAPEGGGAPEIF